MATLTIADLDNGQRDLQTVDAVANSPADTTVTRFGDSVLTLAGALRRLGYKAPVPYASGLAVNNGLFTVSRSGVIYAPDPLLVPFTTGAWAANQWRPVQNTANTNQVYQFPTPALAQAAAATLPEGSAVRIQHDGGNGGFATSGKVEAGQVKIDEYRANAVKVESESELRALNTALTSSAIFDGHVFTFDKSATGAEDGGTTFKSPGGGLWERHFSGRAKAEWFGAVGDYYREDGSISASPTDNAPALAKIKAYLERPSMQARTVEFGPGGFYSSQNLSINYPNRYILGCGRNITRLIFSAPGVAVQFNKTHPNHGVYAFGGGMQGVGIRGNANTSILLDIDGLNHCRFVDIDVAEASPTLGKGYRVGGVVCGHFEDIVYSANATIMASPAFNGLFVELDYAGTARPTGNTFINVIIEGAAGDGCVLTDAENNTFVGGTVENNAGNNINVGPTCRTNTFIGTAFESRVTSYADVYDAGHMTRLLNCYTSRWIRTAPSSFMFSVEGGVHGSFDLQGAYGKVDAVEYAFFGPGTFNAHPSTKISRLFNKVAGGLEFPKVASFSIPAPSSPTNWSNSLGSPVQIITAGTGIVRYKRSGAAIADMPIGGSVTVLPGDSITVTWSSGTPVISGVPL